MVGPGQIGQKKTLFCNVIALEDPIILPVPCRFDPNQMR
jgi:hypothetical protein